MAEIKNKFSDFQTSECDTQESIEPIDERLCPTCQPNPEWKLPAPHWSDISDAYLNESVCEYHVRVYENEVKRINNTSMASEEDIKLIGVERILVDLDKPLNDGTTQQLFNACFIVDNYRNIESQELGVAYLVGVPAFNMDQIESNDSENAEESSAEQGSGGEILIEFSGLGRKLNQLKFAIGTYGHYYALLNKQDGGFVIRQEDDETQRINYKYYQQKIKEFKSELNDLISKRGYPKIGKPGFFKSKSFKRFKFTFKNSGKPYDLKTIHVYDNGCDKYIKIPVPRGSILRKASMRSVYHFLDKFDEVINDITAKETKPWLDFTLEYFYPKFIVDYGGIGDIDSTKSGLDCLLEMELGIGGGKVIDSLTAEIMSAFDSIEKQLAEQACRSITDLSTESATALAAKNQGLSPKEQREKAMLARYEKEYINKAYKFIIGELEQDLNMINQGEDYKGYLHEGIYYKKITRDITFQVMKKRNKYYDFKIDKRLDNIKNEQQLKENAKDYAGKKFNSSEDGSFSDQIQNSPHFQESMDAAKEVIQNFENTYVDTVKAAWKKRSDIELVDLIPAIGVCGMSKIAGKALNCIANGVSFDDFLDILIEKTFDFMEVNTLSLFLNGLPANFREDLNRAIEEQFGSGADISTLLGIKLAEGNGQTLKDFVKSKQKAKRVLEIFQKEWTDAGVESLYESLTDEEKTYIEGVIGPLDYPYSWNHIYKLFETKDMNWNKESKSFQPDSADKNGRVQRIKPGSESSKKKWFKPEKYIIAWIKYFNKQYKKSQNEFLQAMNRIKASVGLTIQIVEVINDEKKDIKDSIKSLELLIKKEEIKVDELIDQLNQKRLAGDLTKDYEKMNSMKQSYEMIRDYKSQIKQFEKTLKITIKEDYGDTLDLLAKDISQLSLEEIKREWGIVKQSFKTTAQAVSTAIDNSIDLSIAAIDKSIITQAEADYYTKIVEPVDPSKLSPFEQAANSFQTTALGVKVDIVFDLVFDFLIDYIMDSFAIDDLFNRMRSYPAVDFALDKVEQLFLNPCPVAPVIYPPANDFMKSLSVDICDPTLSLTFPKLIVPNINIRFNLESQFNEIFREAIIKLVSDMALSMLMRFMRTLESSLCNLVESAGGIVADALKGDLKGSFYRALNEAFCNDGENPETSRSKAEELAEALFSPLGFDADGDYSGAGAKVSNIISSVASTEEFLHAMVAREGEENEQFNNRIANSITALAPEMEVLLGDPNQVAYFFKSLGSFLSPDDRERIRDMLAAGVPNLPISQAICLTNDQLEEWNKLREDLLGGDTDRVRKLNDATLAALSDIMDDIANLESDGPFIGAATNEAMKDVCNPNNVFNDVSQSDIDKSIEDELTDAFYDNISRTLTRGFMSRGGILAEAMRDVEGRREFGRNFQKIFRWNYGNSQPEQDNKFNNAWKITQFIMNLGDDEDGDGIPDVQGRYPDTVAIKQRKEILGADGITFDFDKVKSGMKSSGNIVYKYLDADKGFSYIQQISTSNLRKVKTGFGYNIQVIETIDKEDPYVELNINIANPISKAQNDYMESVGFQYKSNSKDDIRKAAFNQIVKNKIPLSKSYNALYEKIFESSNKKIVEALLSNYESVDGLPTGYKYGYVSDDLTEASFQYTPSPNEGELGKFASPRIIALDPKIYGGRYSNPPYYVEPRRFTGWLELATTAFESQEGCDPKTPPIISFSDIKQRTKNLNSSLKNDPRLSKPKECISLKPFHLLLDSKNKAKLDGVVRTTLRTYLAEFFIKGYGLLSNLQIRSENFDDAMLTYIVSKIKSEMQELGSRFSNKKIRIVRERYWYAFLEQCVEAYQRTIDVDGVEAPENVMNALNTIQLGLDKFRPVDKEMKKSARKQADEISLVRPQSSYDPLSELEKGDVYNLLMSVAFRLADEDERDSFFNGQQEDKIKGYKIRYASIKKLAFFQKIYFIKLFENEAITIMSEFVKQELSRLSDLVSDGPTDKPYYFDLYKSFFGMKSFFPTSTSRVGLNSYYLDKQRGVIDPGSIQTVRSTNDTTPVQPTSEPQFIVESYVRLEDKPNSTLLSRPEKYKGVVSLDDMSSFVSQNLDSLDEKYLSDFFGDLSFLYKSSFKRLMAKGFSSQENIEKLIQLNPDVDLATIKLAHYSHITSKEYVDFEVFYDQSFVLEGETPKPAKTIGSTGVKYGLRVSVVAPLGTFGFDEITAMKSNAGFMQKSKLEKAYLFADNTFMLPLASAEIDVVDASFEDFDPFSGTERYDLECLINKIVTMPEFTVMFDKLLNFRQASSMLAIYCMETLPAAIGRDESEREDLRSNPDVDDWDRTVNKFGKNFLRREFKSLYLSNTEDGLSDDDDDDESSGDLLKLNNPFDFLMTPSIKLPWWLSRRAKTKVYDANGQECASPEKDLQ